MPVNNNFIERGKNYFQAETSNTQQQLPSAKGQKINMRNPLTSSAFQSIRPNGTQRNSQAIWGRVNVLGSIPRHHKQVVHRFLKLFWNIGQRTYSWPPLMTATPSGDMFAQMNNHTPKTEHIHYHGQQLGGGTLQLWYPVWKTLPPPYPKSALCCYSFGIRSITFSLLPHIVFSLCFCF